jgi:hypothetical protein
MPNTTKPRPKPPAKKPRPKAPSPPKATKAPARQRPMNASTAAATGKAPAAGPTRTPARGRGSSLGVLLSPDRRHFEIVQARGKVCGSRAGRVGAVGKATGRAYPTEREAREACRARIAELRALGYTPASLAQISGHA